MSAESVIGGIIGAWSGITTTGYPSVLWFDGVPVKDSAGAAVALPTVELLDRGTVPEYDFEADPFEVTSVTFVVRAATLAEADSIAKRVKYGGGATFTAGAGYDQPAALSLASNVVLMSMIRTREIRSREAPRDGSVNPVHKIELDYEVRTRRTGV